MKELSICNRQRTRKLDTKLMRQIVAHVLEQVFGLKSYSCAVQIVSPKRMAEVNWEFLQHEGSTDVITFDYKDYPDHDSLQIAGEIFICFEEAVKQAKEFSTSSQSELVRYAVHGILHLLGYDDLTPEKRKIMKREENRVVRLLEKRFEFASLS
jgi:probable rRNA maturation factor